MRGWGPRSRRGFPRWSELPGAPGRRAGGRRRQGRLGRQAPPDGANRRGPGGKPGGRRGEVPAYPAPERAQAPDRGAKARPGPHEPRATRGEQTGDEERRIPALVTPIPGPFARNLGVCSQSAGNPA